MLTIHPSPVRHATGHRLLVTDVPGEAVTHSHRLVGQEFNQIYILRRGLLPQGRGTDMAFKDAGEVRKYIGGIFESAFADPEIGPKLAATGVVLGFEFSEPEAFLVID